MGHRRFLGKKHPYRAMDCQFNGERNNQEAPLHVTGDLVHLKVKDIKTIEELPNLTEKTLGKKKKRDDEAKEGMWNTKSILWDLEYWPMLDVRHSTDNMHVKKNVYEATCGTLLQHKSKGKNIKMQGRFLKSWALGRSSMQRKQRWGRTFPLLQPPCQRQREKNSVSFCMI
jgi:hypothetical protein